MIALSIALVVIAALAHHAVLTWLRANTGWLLRVEEAERLAKKAVEASNTTAVSAQKALDDLTGRVRSCELKAGIVGNKRREADGAPMAG